MGRIITHCIRTLSRSISHKSDTSFEDALIQANGNVQIPYLQVSSGLVATTDKVYRRACIRFDTSDCPSPLELSSVLLIVKDFYQIEVAARSGRSPLLVQPYLTMTDTVGLANGFNFLQVCTASFTTVGGSLNVLSNYGAVRQGYLGNTGTQITSTTNLWTLFGVALDGFDEGCYEVGNPSGYNSTFDGNRYALDIINAYAQSNEFDLGMFCSQELVPAGSAIKTTDIYGTLDIPNFEPECTWPYLQFIRKFPVFTGNIETQNIHVGSSLLTIDDNLLILNNTIITDYTDTVAECIIGGIPLTASYHSNGYYTLQVIRKAGTTLSSEENIFMGHPVKTYVDGNQRYFGTKIYQNGDIDNNNNTVINGFPLGIDDNGFLCCIVRDDLGVVDEEAEFIWGSSKVTASRIGDNWYWTIVDQS